jgi:hypothetical protein
VVCQQHRLYSDEKQDDYKLRKDVKKQSWPVFVSSK